MRVLITRLSAFGDIVHTWPLVEALRRAPAPVTVAWVVEEPFLPLVRLHPGVDVAITVATRRWRRAPLAAATRAAVREARAAVSGFGADVAIDPQGLVKSAIWASLARVPRRIGFGAAHRRERPAGLFYTETVTPPAGLGHVIDANLALLGPLGVTAAAGAAPDGRFMLSGGSPAWAPDVRTVGLLPAAGKRGKCWQPDHYASLARRLAAAGWRPLVVVGPGEEPLGRQVVAAAGAAAVLAPPTSLPELARLLAGCRAVIGGDTGPIHLAASLGTPTLAVYLSTDAERKGPRGARVNVVTVARAGAGLGRARTARDGEIAVADVETALHALLQ